MGYRIIHAEINGTDLGIKLSKIDDDGRETATGTEDYIASADQINEIALAGPRVADAQFNLGFIYFNAENKKGELGDFKEAVKWWRKATNQGHETALRLLKDTLKKHPELVDD